MEVNPGASEALAEIIMLYQRNHMGDRRRPSSTKHTTTALGRMLKHLGEEIAGGGDTEAIPRLGMLKSTEWCWLEFEPGILQAGGA